MFDFVSYTSKAGIPVGCRDWYTVRMLKEQGICNAIMTGCPAWYDMQLIKDLAFHGKRVLKKDDYQNIIISDAAYAHNTKYMKTLLEVVRDYFPLAKVKVLLHRGITKQNAWLLNERYQSSLQYVAEDISGSEEGFAMYDECDLHIGFRVQAHIYNLSIGNASFLINEDARGAGVNDALGIRNVFIGKYLRKQLYDYFDFLNATEMHQYVQACENLKFYYSIMQKYIANIVSL